jgi:hypothetical protein
MAPKYHPVATALRLVIPNQVRIEAISGIQHGMQAAIRAAAPATPAAALTFVFGIFMIVFS